LAKLIYSMLASLDGYVADEDGKWDWARPDAEVHSFVNDLSRPIGTYLLGRRMYDVLVAWETIDTTDEPPQIQDFAGIWRATDKIVYSTTLDRPSSDRTRIEREFDAEEVRALKESTDRDLVIGGPTLAAKAFAANLIDDCHLFLAPIVVGGGTRCLPDDVRVPLELLDERRFGNGMVHLGYRTAGASPA
jgi:dihydrofolate reductase